MEQNNNPKISKFSIILSAGAIFIIFYFFGSILYDFPNNQYLAFSIMMGILSLIAGIIIGLEKNTKKTSTSLIAGILTALLYFFTSVPSRAADFKMFILVLLSSTIPMILGTWLISVLKK